MISDICVLEDQVKVLDFEIDSNISVTDIIQDYLRNWNFSISIMIGKMSKRQRSDREVVTACDLADAIEEIQDTIPEFSVEKVLNRTKIVNRLLREIPQDVDQLYSLLSNRDWHAEIILNGEKKGHIYVEIGVTLPEKEQLRQRFCQFGFRTYSLLSQEHESIIMESVHPNPSQLSCQLMILRDRYQNPMALLSRNYETPDIETFIVGSNM